jgi:hypothetical protein
VTLDRYFDGDIDMTSGGDFYDRTSRPGFPAAGSRVSVTLEANGLMLTSLRCSIRDSPFSGWDPL